MASKNFIGQRIKTMRLSRGMTQADLAKAIGQSQASITMYETGKREPDFETLEALADDLDAGLYGKKAYTLSAAQCRELKRNYRNEQKNRTGGEK